MAYIIFEGLDGSGKTSTLNIIKKKRKQKDNILDRFIGSMIVYGTIFKRYNKRDIEKQYFDDKKFQSNFNPILIYLHAPVRILIKRMKKNKHEEIDKNILKKSSKEFNKYFDRCCYEYKIKINTNKYKQQEVVKKIINFLENVENKQFDYSQ